MLRTRRAGLAALLLLATTCVAAAAASQRSPDSRAASLVAAERQSAASWRRQLRAGAHQSRALLHGGIDHGSEEEEAAHDAAEGPAAATTDAAVTGGGRSYTWLKWTAAAVLLVEGLIGVLLPVVLKVTVHAGWLLSLVNCFAGGVFFSFGVLHLGPDALEAQEAVGLDRFPLAAFFIALAFFAVFFLHRTLAPALRLTPHLHSAYPEALGPVPASPENGVAKCGRCGEGCDCQAGACTCEHRKDAAVSASADEVSADREAHAASFGPTAATLASAAAPLSRQQQPRGPRSRAALKAAALVPPILILLGILCHTVLEGLAIGLQQSYGDVVTAFVAMASHKWVESIAVAAAFVAAGSGMLAVVAFLIPFSLGPLVGIAIGVSVDNTNAWVVMVLFALVAGLFLYVGSVGLVAEEFAKYDDPNFAATRPRGARFWMFGALFFGFVVVALLQLVPEA